MNVRLEIFGKLVEFEVLLLVQIINSRYDNRYKYKIIFEGKQAIFSCGEFYHKMIQIQIQDAVSIGNNSGVNWKRDGF